MDTAGMPNYPGRWLPPLDDHPSIPSLLISYRTMYSRWFDVAVVAFWLVMMQWLVVTKVMPSLLVGEPPNYRTILAAQREDPPAGWQISWDGRRLGWAVSKTKSLPQEITEVRSLIHFDDLPLDRLVPDWLRVMAPPIGRQRMEVPVESRSTLVFDPLGRLSRFESSVRLDAQEPFVKMRGSLDGSKMALWLRVGGLPPFETDVDVPRDAMLGETLSPQSHLPGLHEGQSWTMESYSPLRPPSSPKEILHATVEATTPLVWQGRTVDTRLVVYRSDPGDTVGHSGGPRGKLWVRPDGTVLKQEVTILRSTMTFLRMGPEEAAALAAKASLDD